MMGVCKVMQKLQHGETFTVYSGGGNGYGDTADRDQTLVERDLLDDKISS